MSRCCSCQPAHYKQPGAAGKRLRTSPRTRQMMQNLASGKGDESCNGQRTRKHKTCRIAGMDCNSADPVQSHNRMRWSDSKHALVDPETGLECLKAKVDHYCHQAILKTLPHTLEHCRDILHSVGCIFRQGSPDRSSVQEDDSGRDFSTLQ